MEKQSLVFALQDALFKSQLKNNPMLNSIHGTQFTAKQGSASLFQSLGQLFQGMIAKEKGRSNGAVDPNFQVS